jgi:hypothetical protein
MFSPDNTGGFSRAPSYPAPAAQATVAPQASRCYRTSAEGRIALRPDWPVLLETARGLGRVVVQTRHMFARLIAVADIPGFVARADGGSACAEDGTLSFRFSEWWRAWGWLTACPCCGSPARVEVWNARALPFLQVCAPAQGGLEGWAGVLDALATGTEDDADALTASALTAGESLPKTPRDAHAMRFDEDLLLELLASLDSRDLPVRWILRTREACHAREFAPRRAGIAQRALTVKDGAGHTLQLGLPAARSLAIGTGASRSLYIGGRDDSLLVEMAPPADPAFETLWRAVVHGVFSGWL